jgi:hypothetical protein
VYWRGREDEIIRIARKMRKAGHAVIKGKVDGSAGEAEGGVGANTSAHTSCTNFSKIHLH